MLPWYHTDFEEIVEAVAGGITMLGISLTDSELRLVADCAEAPAGIGTKLPLTVKQSDGLFFFIIRLKEDRA